MSGQVDFSRALVDPNVPPPSGLRKEGGRIPSRRFNVYRNNVTVSLCDALAQTFPVVRQMVGDEFFAAMAREFVLVHPPKSPIMSGYGEEFPDFVRAFGPAASLPYLADLARLEFLQVEAFHAADAAPFEPGLLATFVSEQLADLRFRAHPATRIITSAFAVASLWFAHHGQGDLGDIDPARPETVLITRPDFAVRIYRLPQGAFPFFSSVLAGQPLGVGAQEALPGDETFDLPGALALLLESGATEAVTLEKDAEHGPI
ncbi:MAG: hypothetical protein FD175_2064 [Beijerinckiaceae bacterium]|nr:MAG: hypothetical protein FD175_2064 [Beijerinckiaceae bacterium]